MQVVEASDGEICVWGPMSAELASKDGKLIPVEAIEKRLPNLLRRARLSLHHDDTAVGEILPVLVVDEERLPEDKAVRAMVEEVVGEWGGLPTAVLEITPAMVQVFPRLGALEGRRAPFLAGRIFEDDRIGELVRKDIENKVLDSLSISGATWDSEVVEHCNDLGCVELQKINDLDLSMVTITSSQGEEATMGASQAANAAAGLVIVQQAKRLSQPIKARGLEFPDFDACLKWAEGIEGIDDAGAFCGALKKESQAEASRSTEEPDPALQSTMGSKRVKQAVDALPADEAELERVLDAAANKRQAPTRPVKSLGAGSYHFKLYADDALEVTNEGRVVDVPDALRERIKTILQEQEEDHDYLPLEDIVNAERSSEEPQTESEAQDDSMDTEEREPEMEPEDEADGNEDVLVELVRRVEGLEKKVAAMEDNEETPEAEDEADDDEEDEKVMEQAKPVTVEQAKTLIKEAISGLDIKSQIQEALKVQKPGSVRQTVQTPEPSGAAPEGSNEEYERLIQKLDEGDPGAFRETLHALQGGA